MSYTAQTSALFSTKGFSLPLAGAEVGFRPAAEEDREFLFRVYAASRNEEMKLVNWDDIRKDEFLRMQFSAQDKYYREYYPSAVFLVLLFEDNPCGRLYIDRWDSEIRIVDIALLPEFRNRGVGTAALRYIMDEGGKLGLPVTIHVEQFNPALRLYQRLRFLPVRENGVYLLLKQQSTVQTDCKADLNGAQIA